MIKKILHFIPALIKRILTGRKNVTNESYLVRIKICNNCKFRDVTKNECSICGCPVMKKAWWASENCPKKYWPRPQVAPKNMINKKHRIF